MLRCCLVRSCDAPGAAVVSVKGNGSRTPVHLLRLTECPEHTDDHPIHSSPSRDFVADGRNLIIRVLATQASNVTRVVDAQSANDAGSVLQIM